MRAYFYSAVVTSLLVLMTVNAHASVTVHAAQCRVQGGEQQSPLVVPVFNASRGWIAAFTSSNPVIVLCPVPVDATTITNVVAFGNDASTATGVRFEYIETTINSDSSAVLFNKTTGTGFQGNYTLGLVPFSRAPLFAAPAFIRVTLPGQSNSSFRALMFLP